MIEQTLFFQAGGLDLGTIWGGAGSALAGGATTFFYGLGILMILSAVGYLSYKKWQNMTFYKIPVSLTVIMENGTEKTRNDLRGGVFLDKGTRNFKIKIPKTRKPHILGYIPDYSKADGDGRLKFITVGDRTIWQQYESKWNLKGKKIIDGKEFSYDLINFPVPRETKVLTINSIKNWRDTVDKSKLTAFGIAIGGFIIMVIAHLISLFIQTKIRCGPA